LRRIPARCSDIRIRNSRVNRIRFPPPHELPVPRAPPFRRQSRESRQIVCVAGDHTPRHYQPVHVVPCTRYSVRNRENENSTRTPRLLLNRISRWGVPRRIVFACARMINHVRGEISIRFLSATDILSFLTLRLRDGRDVAD